MTAVLEVGPATTPATGEVIDYVARRAARKYDRWVDVEDVTSELWIYALGDGAKHLARFVEDGEPRRTFLTLFGAATRFCEAEKAARSGYHPDDVAWYAPGRIAELVPLALDPMFDGMTREDTGEDVQIKSSGFGPEGGNLLVQVFDVRAALSKLPAARHAFTYASSDSDEYSQACEQVSERLGGDYPDAPGYRRSRRLAESNVAAQQRTRGDW